MSTLAINILNAGINAVSSFNVYGGTTQAGLGFKFFGSSIQTPLGQYGSLSISSVSTYTTMYLGTFDQYAPGRGASLGFGANNTNGLQTLQGRITGTPTTYTPAGGDQGTLNFDVNASGQMYNVMTMWAIGGQPAGRVGINGYAPSVNLDVNGTMRVSSTASFASNVTVTANGVTTLLVSNNASSATNYLIKCEMTGANFQVRQHGITANIAIIENTGGGGLLLNPLGATVGIGSSNIPSFPLDVFGVARSAIPISSLTGTSATFANSSYGIYYYITNSAFATINLVGGTPSPAAGWYVTLRNNTGSYLSCTITGAVSSTPASPVTIPPSNSVTIAYDNATSLYVLF